LRATRKRPRTVPVRPSLVGALALAVLLVLMGALMLAGVLPGAGASRAAAQPATTETIAQTDDSVPARNVTMIGATPSEAGAPGENETWGVGEHGSTSMLVRYTTQTGWSLGPALPGGFKLDQSPLAGQMTAGGSGVLVGTVPVAEGSTTVRPVVLVRNPGGSGNSFTETPRVPTEGEPLGVGEEALLKKGEALFSAARAPLIAPLEESSSQAGAFVVPVLEHGSGVEGGVLHWDGSKWTREQIEVPTASAKDFRVLAIGASSPTNAWLLAQLSAGYPAGAVALFRRHAGEGAKEPNWRPVALEAGAKPGEADPLKVPVSGGGEAQPFTVSGTGEPPTVQNQILTVTSEGVWIDGLRQDVGASTTMFLEPEGEGESDSGKVIAGWCVLPEGTAAGTPGCQRELPEALPTGPSRSIAWANSSTPEGLGERVITGLSNGVSLRLEGTEFKRVLALGAGPQAGEDPGAQFGAAFTNAREGWLGQELLPVHLTLTRAESQLAPWPVSFRHTLVAVAPQPGVPIGALSSEALAVGDLGEVARYKPGEGWLPESLLGAGERHETPRLRAVAWPTPTRAYAVGVEETRKEGQIWLWRAETGLWERDPATPLNFRGSLLGIAFEPNNPSRGYAVGQQGVLLRYGKTWTQDTLPAEAPCSPAEATNPEEAEQCASWSNASFTSVAFAGSEAIVAYRILPDRNKSSSYRGGLIVNSGSGWHIDQGAAAAIGANVPWAVAGLGDGGAAFAASGSVYEREGPGASWQPTPTPFPGGGEPGSLSLFREGGALRVIASGSVPFTYSVESEPKPPSEAPPTFINPYPLDENSERGVIRQTANGWSDEEHELNNVREPPGKYAFYDTVYQPDPIEATLIDPTGTQGWAIGGFVEPTGESHGGVLDTADVDRYPAEKGTAPPGIGASPVSAHYGNATFAIGGNAECSAPCADRANAQLGPEVWLSAALARAGRIPGARAFLYTGPHITTGETAGPAELAVPYERELHRYAELLGSSPIPAFAAATPADLDIARDEGLFEEQFSGFPQPFGSGPPFTSFFSPVGEATERQTCANAQGCEAGYYAFESKEAALEKALEAAHEPPQAARVRVIVLDTSVVVDKNVEISLPQREWLAGQLVAAENAKEPAIVVGNADLNAQIANGDASAAAVAQILGNAKAPASAYFYDSPEENITEPLRGAEFIPTFGSGTLGYVNYQAESSGHFLGASGFLLGEVDLAGREANNFAPVHARLIPNVGELALEATDGTLLRRSNPAQFAGLARRPRAGNQARNESTRRTTDPYIPIPSPCVGTVCANGIFPEYTFTSSEPDIGGFVVENLAAANPHTTPLQGPGGQPIPDEPRNAKGELTANGQFEENGKGQPINEKGEVVPSAPSALFCAYNKGTTTVTIDAGGLSSSLPVTVQAGSVREPCGTVPLKHLAAVTASAAAPVPPPAPAPAPAGPAPASSPPLVPVPPTPVIATPAPPVRPTPPLPAPFFIQPALPVPLPAFIPVPPPAPAEPTPPSGTSAVTSPVEAAEKEEEEEEATESVSNQAMAYHAPEHEPSPVYLLGLLALAAFAGASVARRRPRGGRREVRVAPATLSGMRSQRRMGSERKRLP
jgi:hypothetical protein